MHISSINPTAYGITYEINDYGSIVLLLKTWYKKVEWGLLQVRFNNVRISIKSLE